MPNIPTAEQINNALPLLANRKLIHCYFDNDNKGRETVEKLKRAGFTVKDWSESVYPMCKDLNEYLIGCRNGTIAY